MKPEQFQYPEGAAEPLVQRLHRTETGSGNLDRNQEERNPITPELREKYDKQLAALGELMKDSGVWWQLDGAMNISLYQKKRGGDYIGEHADIDMSVRRDELPKLQEYLRQKGYGLFIRTKDGKYRDWRRVGSEVFKVGRGESPHIVAIDETGVIRTDADLVKVEMAVIDVDDEGFPLANKARYPKEWLSDHLMELGGEELHLSHPARFLIWKIWMGRGYDEKDFELLARTGELKLEDIDAVERVLEDEVQKNNLEKEKDFAEAEAFVRNRLTKMRAILGSKS